MKFYSPQDLALPRKFNSMMKNLKLFFSVLPSLYDIKNYLKACDVLGIVEGVRKELTEMQGIITLFEQIQR